MAFQRFALVCMATYNAGQQQINLSIKQMFHEFIHLQSWIPIIIYGGSGQSIFLNATGLCDFCVVVVFFHSLSLPPCSCFSWLLLYY